MPTGDYAARTTSHRPTLGILWILFGIFRLIAALWMIGFTPTATLMFGALLNRVANPEALMAEFHVWYLFAVVWTVACGIVGAIAGVGLLARGSAGRVLAIIAAFLALPDLPLGVMLGTYTLIIFLRPAGSSGD